MTFERIYVIALSVMVSLWLPLPGISSPTIILFGFIVLYGVFTKKLRFQWNWILIGFVLLFLLYAMYLFPSRQIYEASKDLERKLSLLIFPFLFSFRPSFEISRNKLLFAFTIGCLVLGLYSVLQSIYHYIGTHDPRFFHSSAFSPIHHPSYVAAFLSFSLFFLIDEFFPNLKKNAYSFAITIAVFFAVLHLPLESLAGVLVLMGMSSFLILKWAWKRFSKWVFSGILLLIFLSSQLVFLMKPSLKVQLENTSTLVAHYVSSPSKFIKETPKGMSGNQMRLVLWTTTAEIICQHPFGIGLGNLNSELQQRLTSLRQDELASKNLNPHNQFLQITAEIGLFGLLLFCALLLKIVQFARQRKDSLLIFLVISLAVNSLFESMLQRQSGIVFYLMFISLFVTVIQKEKKTIRNHLT